jgi:putative transcriptional regulator
MCYDYGVIICMVLKMATIKTGSLFQLWTRKEQRENRRITLTEVSEATGLSPETIRKLLKNQTRRFDESVIIALCEYFEVPPGPVPFVVYEPDEAEQRSPE